ncbi:hypothetical protein NDU88_004117 [Pleurodeles waltl]|uniref:Uncharacterized protein n=1 Tax=Pleurodeles waltl TaxID=8319 RepID=A0AAV7V222_PLEWA|nr:hypothetical protein NDU88_004117 [Pleurodeles waltl]
MDKKSFFRGRQKSSPDTKSSSEGWENKLVDAVAAEGPASNHHSRLGDNVEIFDLEHSEGIEVSSSDSHVLQADDLEILDIELGDTEDRSSTICFLAKDEKIKNDGKAQQTMVPASPSPFLRRENIFPTSSCSSSAMDIYEQEDSISDRSFPFPELERIPDENIFPTSSCSSSAMDIYEQETPFYVFESAAADLSIDDKVPGICDMFVLCITLIRITGDP